MSSYIGHHYRSQRTRAGFDPAATVQASAVAAKYGRCYLSTAMTGRKGRNVPVFDAVAAQLSQAGVDVFSPVENGVGMTATWREHMRADLRALATCDTLVLLPGWWRAFLPRLLGGSRGVRLELLVARSLGLRVVTWRRLRRELERASR